MLTIGLRLAAQHKNDEYEVDYSNYSFYDFSVSVFSKNVLARPRLF